MRRCNISLNSRNFHTIWEVVRSITLQEEDHYEMKWNEQYQDDNWRRVFSDLKEIVIDKTCHDFIKPNDVFEVMNTGIAYEFRWTDQSPCADKYTEYSIKRIDGLGGQVYRSEKEIKEALKWLLAEGIRRKQFISCSKN